jgi:hypothetical protein
MDEPGSARQSRSVSPRKTASRAPLMGMNISAFGFKWTRFQVAEETDELFAAGRLKLPAAGEGALATAG